MQTTIQYAGDANLMLLMSAIGVQKSFPEVRSYLMRIIWGPKSQLPSEVMEDLLGADKEDVVATVEYEQFREQILALWNDLTQHRDADKPFSLHQFEAAHSPEDLVGRVKCRVKEAQMLMPLFGDTFPNSKSAHEAGTIKEKVIRSLEKLSIVLDALVSGEALGDLPQTELVLRVIDSELETGFNRLGQLFIRSIKPSQEKTFTVAGNSGEA